MAKLLKDRARKPILDTAVASGARSFSDGKVAYQLDLYQRTGKDHFVILTREEMLTLVASWISAEARDAVDEAKKKAAAMTQHERQG